MKIKLNQKKSGLFTASLPLILFLFEAESIEIDPKQDKHLPLGKTNLYVVLLSSRSGQSIE